MRDLHGRDRPMIDPRDEGPMWFFMLLIILFGITVGFLLFGATAAFSQERGLADDDRDTSTRMARRATGKPAGRRSRPPNVSLIPHPPGCPARAFCACGASVKVFGKSVRSLWPSSAWLRFPRSSPGHMRVAVRRGHVFVIDYMVDGSTAMAWDYNSGRRLSRYHPRSIVGYRIVDPRA